MTASPFLASRRVEVTYSPALADSRPVGATTIVVQIETPGYSNDPHALLVTISLSGGVGFRRETRSQQEEYAFDLGGLEEVERLRDTLSAAIEQARHANIHPTDYRDA